MANGNWTVRLATRQLAAADGPLRHIETNPAGQIAECQDVLRHDGNSSASMISGTPETKLARQNVTNSVGASRRPSDDVRVRRATVSRNSPCASAEQLPFGETAAMDALRPFYVVSRLNVRVHFDAVKP
jgi:hypothetical protein